MSAWHSGTTQGSCTCTCHSRREAVLGLTTCTHLTGAGAVCNVMTGDLSIVSANLSWPLGAGLLILGSHCHFTTVHWRRAGLFCWVQTARLEASPLLKH